jgi:hypothetical protein
LTRAPLEAAVEEAEGAVAQLTAHRFAIGRWSAALGGEPLDAATGNPVEVKPPSHRK